MVSVRTRFSMGRGDSMNLAFHMPPLASGQGLCDINRVELLTKKMGSLKIIESPLTMGYIENSIRVPLYDFC